MCIGNFNDIFNDLYFKTNTVVPTVVFELHAKL